MKKVLAILVAMMLAVSMIPFSLFAEEEVDQDGYDGNFNPANTKNAQRLDQSIATMGALFTTVGPVLKVAVGCPSWSNNVGSLTVSLYKWDTDYDTTTKAEPLDSKVCEDYEDNEHLGFTFSTDSPLPAGSYYIELSDGFDESGSGVGVWTGLAWPGQAVFIDGRYNSQTSLRMTVDYVTDPGEKVYGDLPEIDGTELPLGNKENKYPAPYYIDMTDGSAELFTGTGNQVEATATEDGTLLFTVPAGSGDPYHALNFVMVGIDDLVSCAEYPYLAMSVRIAGAADAPDGEIFFFTSSVGGATPGYSAALPYDHSTSDWQTVVLNPMGNAMFITNAEDGDNWTGIRFDVLAAASKEDFTLELKWIAFFSNEEAAMAFDGDFSSLPTPTPTAEPTATPEATATPAPTNAPDASDATAAPEEKSGCGSVISGGIAIVAVMAGGAMLLGKKKRR